MPSLQSPGPPRSGLPEAAGCLHATGPGRQGRGTSGPALLRSSQPHGRAGEHPLSGEEGRSEHVCTCVCARACVRYHRRQSVVMAAEGFHGNGRRPTRTGEPSPALPRKRGCRLSPGMPGSVWISAGQHRTVGTSTCQVSHGTYLHQKCCCLSEIQTSRGHPGPLFALSGSLHGPSTGHTAQTGRLPRPRLTAHILAARGRRPGCRRGPVLVGTCSPACRQLPSCRALQCQREGEREHLSPLRRALTPSPSTL